jgi:very-short-patch-repair endonuclease
MKKNHPFLPYDVRLTEKARENRRNPTPAEKRLWHDVLGQKEFEGLKFTRQKPIDHYIVDFYCSKLKLVIEIDGDSHSENAEYDRRRTERLGSLGVCVLRYSNHDILHNLNSVYLDLVDKIRDFEKKPKPVS